MLHVQNNKKQYLTKLKNIILNIKFPIIIFITSRLIILIAIEIGLVIQPTVYNYQNSNAFGNNQILNGLIKWDADWYKDIAENGYNLNPRHLQQSNIAFMPLYPIVIRIFDLFINNIYLSGIFVSNFSFLLALILIYRMVNLDFNHTIANRTILFLAFFQFSFFFSSMYAESLLLLLIICFYFFMNNEKWFCMSISAALATLTKITGISLIILLLYLIFFENKKRNIPLYTLIISSTGLIIYSIYSYIKFNNPFAYFEAITSWSFVRKYFYNIQFYNLNQIKFHINNSIIYYGYQFLLTILIIALLIFAYKKLPNKYLIFSWIIFIFSISQWWSIGRYSIIMFPLFILIAIFSIRMKTIYNIYLFLNTIFLIILSILYSHGYAVF